MAAISVREAIRDAVAAFCPSGTAAAVPLASPATPEAILRAVEAMRQGTPLPVMIPEPAGAIAP
jgi:xanthine dehydrogenase large subunit